MNNIWIRTMLNKCGKHNRLRTILFYLHKIQKKDKNKQYIAQECMPEIKQQRKARK